MKKTRKLNNRLRRDKLMDLRNICDTQGMDGNWNYDPYNQGLYNGLEMALSIMEGREPSLENYQKRR